MGLLQNMIVTQIPILHESLVAKAITAILNVILQCGKMISNFLKRCAEGNRSFVNLF